MHLIQLMEAVEQHIKEKKISKTQFAEQIGVTRPHLYKMLNGETGDINLSVFIKIAYAVEQHPVALLRTMLQQPHRNYAKSTERKVAYDGDAIGYITSIDEGDFVYAQSNFSLTWIIQNIGRREWVNRRLVCMDEQVEIQHKGGDATGIISNLKLTPEKPEISIPPTKPWEKIELTVNFTAPSVTGDVYSHWKMVDQYGKLCFPENHPLFCRFTVMAI